LFRHHAPGGFGETCRAAHSCELMKAKEEPNRRRCRLKKPAGRLTFRNASGRKEWLARRTSPIEVVWHGNLARHKAEPAHLSARWSAKGRDFYYGFPCLRDNKRLTLRVLFQESRELGFGLVNIHGFHVLDE